MHNLSDGFAPVNGAHARAGAVRSLNGAIMVGVVTDDPHARGGYVLIPPQALQELGALFTQLAAQSQSAA